MFTLQLVGTVLAADFVSGVVHWAEDAYARPGMPLVDRIARDNLEHHERPRSFLARTWWESSWDLALAGALLVLAAHLGGWLTWHVWLFVVLAVNANQFHKWAHRNASENAWPVRVLQRLYLLQTPRHHARHHSGARDTHYCVVTNFLNPLLEEVMFWKRLERAIEKACGVKRRVDAMSGRPAAVPGPCARCAARPVAYVPA